MGSEPKCNLVYGTGNWEWCTYGGTADDCYVSAKPEVSSTGQMWWDSGRERMMRLGAVIRRLTGKSRISRLGLSPLLFVLTLRRELGVPNCVIYSFRYLPSITSLGNRVKDLWHIGEYVLSCQQLIVIIGLQQSTNVSELNILSRKLWSSEQRNKDS